MVCSWAWKMFPVTTELHAQPPPPNRTSADGSPNNKQPKLDYSYRERAMASRNAGKKVSGTSIQEQWAHYISIELASRCNVSEFWSDTAHITAMPSLSRLAQHVLCIPATSAPVERIFSHGGIVLRPHRAMISDTNLEHMIVLKCNRLVQ